MEARHDRCEQQRIAHIVRKHPCSIAIVLSNDYGKESCKYIYHSGDLLTGELSILCETGLAVDDILLWFEGKHLVTTTFDEVRVLMGRSVRDDAYLGRTS